MNACLGFSRNKEHRAKLKGASDRTRLHTQKEFGMHSVFYIIGVVVVVLAVLSFIA